jgi:hypothetical protein
MEESSANRASTSTHGLASLQECGRGLVEARGVGGVSRERRRGRKVGSYQRYKSDFPVRFFDFCRGRSL